MANLRITCLGHGGVLYRSPEDVWIWVDRWSGAPNYAEEFRTPERVNVIAPTHGHFDHVGDDLSDVAELAGTEGAVVVCSHEMSLQLSSMGIEAVGMNAGGTFDDLATCAVGLVGSNIWRTVSDAYSGVNASSRSSSTNS